jgi:carboxyl-terminal processing protease
MASGLSGFLLPEKGHSLGVMVTREAQLDLNIFPRPAGQQWKGRVALLVDGGSASTSEIFAAGLRELGRARVFGERTAGAALPSTFERLPNGDRIQLAMADLTTPKGYRIEGQGVVPDTAAPHTAASLAAGQDAALVAALAWLQSPETP